MPAPVMRFTFIDGRTEDVTLNTRVLIEAERKFGEKLQSHFIEGQCYGAWCRLGRPDTYEEWLDTVENMEPVSADGEVVTPVPSLPAASDDS